MNDRAPTPLRAIVVEDSEDDLLILERHLRRSGYEPELERVATSEEFEQAIDRGGWDIVFADYVLPGYGGLAALKAVQERGLDLPFIVVSGKIGEDTAVEAMKAGAHDYVMKSNLARLAPAIERELRDAETRSEQRLIASELALQRAALGAAANLIFITDPKGRIEWVNNAFVQKTGYAREEVLGQTPRVLSSGAQEPSVFRDLWATISAGEIWHGELVDRRKDGSLYTVMQTITPFRDEIGHITHLLSIQEDVTAEREARRALAERTLELERSNRELEEFAHIASHDLSAPLRMIGGYIELFDRRHGESLGAEAKALLEKAVVGTVRMQRLIDDLLLYAQASRDPLELADVDTAEILRDVIEDFGAQIGETGAEIEVGAMPHIRGAYAPLSQVLHNLVGNALKFANGPQPHIRVSAFESGRCWRFSVRDDGIGIEPQHAESAFRMFQRLNGAHYPGTGMGLALSQRIVQRLGGETWHEPAPGSGSIFSFTIPLEQATA